MFGDLDFIVTIRRWVKSIYFDCTSINIYNKLKEQNNFKINPQICGGSS